jgi:hypothetical protein
MKKERTISNVNTKNFMDFEILPFYSGAQHSRYSLRSIPSTLLHSIQTNSGAHPDTCPMSTGGSFPQSEEERA